MRQLITRLDDDLHGRLKERAAAEGKTVNAYVTDVLARAVGADDTRESVAARVAQAGMRVLVPRPRRVPSREKVIAETRGWGRAVSEALEAERRAR
jgi:plasmid stability protein